MQSEARNETKSALVSPTVTPSIIIHPAVELCRCRMTNMATAQVRFIPVQKKCTVLHSADTIIKAHFAVL